MLSSLRRFASTWPARIFFLILVIAFAAWGVGDVFGRLGSDPSTLATVGGRKISVEAFEEAYRRQIAQVSRMFADPSQVQPEIREAIAGQTLDRLIVQQAIANEATRLRLRVPDAALRETVFEIPAFHNASGQFDRAAFEAVLRANNLTEDRLLALVRSDILQGELMEPLRAGVSPPTVLLRRVFDVLAERRVADLVTLRFADLPAPAAPARSVLERYYANNPARYTAPEYRRIRLVVLSPDTLARSVDVPENALLDYYKQHLATYVTPEKRALEVISAGSLPLAQTLAAQWKAGADWSALQAAATKAGAAAVAIPPSAAAEIPSPDLARIAFAAPPGAVVGPVQNPLGWQVLKVTGVLPGTTESFDQARPSIQQTLGRAAAADLIEQRVQRLQDILAGGATLDEIPANIGAAAVSGTLDARGDTLAGNPAPLPVPPAVRSGVLAAAFAAKAGSPPQLHEAGDHVWYAVQVDAVTPPHVQPFDDVQDKVLADWQRDQVRHAQEAAAARLLVAVRHGQSLAEAAHAVGLPVTRTAPFARGKPPAALAPQLVRVLFGLSPGHAGMVETPEGFIVVALVGVQHPQPQDDPQDYASVQSQLTQSLGNDVEITYATALRDAAHPRVNAAALDRIAQQE